MAQGTGTLGSKLFMSTASVLEAVDTEPEYLNRTYNEIGLILNFGEFGRVFTPVTYQTVAEGRTRKLKAGFDDGSIQLVVAQDLSDTGQDFLYTTANASNQNHYVFRITLNDATSVNGGPTNYYFRGLPMSFRTQMGALQVVQATSTIEVNSDILHLPPAQIEDTFSGLTTLTDYMFLYNGSDAEAIDPVVAGGFLTFNTGNASGGTYAANGSQVSLLDGYILADQSIVVMDLLFKIDVITNCQVWIGWSDQRLALELPIEASGVGNGITTNASTAYGFMFDTGMTTDNIWCTSVLFDVDETSVDSGVAFVAATDMRLRTEGDPDGTVRFYINGQLVATMDAASAPILFPTISVSSKNSSAKVGSVNRLYIRAEV